jgi:hypothetical protein
VADRLRPYTLAASRLHAPVPDAGCLAAAKNSVLRIWYSTQNNSDRIWYSVSQKLPQSDEQELKEADQREDLSASTTSDPICSCFFFLSCTSEVI